MFPGMHGVVFALVHAVILLTVSFFVLVVTRKNDSQNLKIFGYAIAVLLWVSAALILGGGLRGNRPMCGKMDRPMMGGQMQKPPMGQPPMDAPEAPGK